MTCREQLDEWVKGNSIHNKDRDECCPDFSCCRPELLASEIERRTFRNGDEKVRTEMLMMFLGAALAKMNVQAYIAGEAEIPNA